jgi:5-carboxymethyl-2-hydroxymuconate isomerase
MPQIVLEYSENIDLPGDNRELFGRIHQILNTVAGIRLENCKSRALMHMDYCIGNGDSSNAFVHLDVRFMEGRTNDIESRIGKDLLELLKNHFTGDPADQIVQITVEVRDIRKKEYFKHPDNL